MKHSRRVEQLAREVTALVVDAGHPVFSDEVRAWLEAEGRGTPGQIFAGSKVAEERGWIIPAGRERKRDIWTAPTGPDTTEASV